MITTNHDERRAQRARAANIFDRLVESNLQLVKTVRLALLIVTTCAVVSLSWSAWATYSMRGTMLEIRALVSQLLVAQKGDSI